MPGHVLGAEEPLTVHKDCGHQGVGGQQGGIPQLPLLHGLVACAGGVPGEKAEGKQLGEV